jgi:hypothetical protein
LSAPAPTRLRAPQSVFLNVPYDSRYQPLFVTLVGTLVCLGQKPRCVLEIQETGQGRLKRTFDLLRSCPISIHDLSRTGPPARFNMPFELGLAYGLVLSGHAHDIVVLDSVPERLDTTLSDCKGREILVHHGRCDQLVACLLDLFDVPDEPEPEALRSMARALRRSAGEIVAGYRTGSLYRPAPFRSLIAAATELAAARGFISP